MTRCPPDNDLAIHRRDKLDFDLQGDIPKYWHSNDPFKTRFFDAMSCLFPEGEKYFIACVRDFKDDIKDPKLRDQVSDFIYQEGQHGKAHTQYNDRLARQGVAVAVILEQQKKILSWLRAHLPATFTLGETVAAEHMTAIMAHGFMRNPKVFNGADERIRALYFWHAIEEIEHKAVAFDVLTKVARASYFTRVLTMFWTSVLFPFHVFAIMNHMFKVDGIKQRWRLWMKGLWWLYGPGGIFLRVIPHYLRYYLPGFHPWQSGDMRVARTWLDTYEQTGDVFAAAHHAVAASS